MASKMDKRHQQACSGDGTGLTEFADSKLLQTEQVYRQMCKVLWHLDIFRRSFRELEGHACMADSCIFCALKELFNQFQYSHESALPPDALRRALAETFANQQRFQLGFMDDAAECFENILLRIHFHVANSESEDMCSALHCISHQKFAMTLVEQRVCHSCGATSEPLPFTQMVHYISSSALCAQSKMNFENGNSSERFGQLLRKACGVGEIRDCPSSCGAKIQIHRTLMNHPEIISIGIVWDSERPTLDHIMNVFQTVGTTIKLQDVFHSVVDGQWANSAAHQLVGVVTYYGKHYSTFFFHTKLRVWIYFDDATVREIGPHWEQVVEKCRRGHFQPLLLLYANPCGTAINTEYAPRTVTYASGHCRNKLMGHMYHPMEKGPVNGGVTSPLRRALTPNSELRREPSSDLSPRRAVTPSADLHNGEMNGGRPGNKFTHNGMAPGVVPVQYQRHPSDSDAGYSSSDRGNPCLSGGTYRESMRRPAIGGGTSETDAVFLNNPAPHPTSGYHHQQYQSYGYDQQKMAPNGPLRANGYFNNCDISNGGLGLPPTPPAVSDKDPATLENIYISRRTVESVLNYQKVQRRQHAGGVGTGTAGNRNSNSSLESFENALRMRSQYNAYYDQMRPEGQQQQIQQPDTVVPAPPSNVPRCRDSGNWSGDRNSASSTSSASLENPYYVMVGNKRSTGPPSPGYHYMSNKTSAEGSTYRPGYDAGYDSFSLSSNDSFPQGGHPKHNQQLAQIPENVLDQSLRRTMYNGESQDECQSLCYEADSFLEKSIEKEQFGDLDGAISLCNGAAAKARAAMDAPYSNPQILAFAKMKHSSCVMRSRSLHRRILARQDSINSHGSSTGTETDSPRKADDVIGDAAFGHHHSRQSSRDSTRSRHSRQGSRDGASHSRQSSRDGGSHSRQSSQDATENKKRIELYGTLPKKSAKKKLDKTRTGSIRLEDENVLHRLSTDIVASKLEAPYSSDHLNAPPIQLGAELLKVQRVNEYVLQKQQERAQQQQQLMMAAAASCTDYSDYSSEWEHTRKPVTLHRTNSIPPNFHQQVELSTSQSFTDLSAAQNKDDKMAAANKMAAAGKKQHKIRRKLLMGGLIRRKNRSMPDLREGQNDASLPNDKNADHVAEHSGAAYQNMYNDVVSRRLHSSHSKIPPPPPVRTTSQLTTRSLSQGNLTTVPGQTLGGDLDGIVPCPPLQPRLVQPLPNVNKHQYPMLSQHPQTSTSNRLTVQADVHHERTPSDGIRPVNPTQRQSLSGATYSRLDNPRSSLSPTLPSTSTSTLTSDQRSLNASPYSQMPYHLQPDVERVSKDNSAGLVNGGGDTRSGQQGGLLAALQAKRRQLLEDAASRSSSDSTVPLPSQGAKLPPPAANDNWLQELQAKQQLLKSKKGISGEVRSATARLSVDQVVAANNYQRSSPVTMQHHDIPPKINQHQPVDAVDGFSERSPSVSSVPTSTEPTDYKPKSVRDLASKFEKIIITPVPLPASAQSPPPLQQLQQPTIKKDVPIKPQVDVQPATKLLQQWHAGNHGNATDRVDGRLLVHTLDLHGQNQHHVPIIETTKEQSRLVGVNPVHLVNRVYDYRPGFVETPSSQNSEPQTKFNGYTSSTSKDPLYVGAPGPLQNVNHAPTSPMERPDLYRINGPAHEKTSTWLDNAQLNQRVAPAYNSDNNYHQQTNFSNGLPSAYLDSNHNAPPNANNNGWTNNQNFHNANVSNIAPAKMATGNCVRKMSDPGFADGGRHPELLSRLQSAQNGTPANPSGNFIPPSTNDIPPPSTNRPVTDLSKVPPSYQNALSMSTMQWPHVPSISSSTTTNGLPATAVAKKSVMSGVVGGGIAAGHHGSLRRNHSVSLPVSANGKEMLPQPSSSEYGVMAQPAESSEFGAKKKKGKKSVTFSDQIALVASADDDVMLPHPLLEKALNRSSIMSKPTQQQIKSPPPSSTSTIQVPVFNEASYAHMTNCNTITNGITGQDRCTLQYKYDNQQPLPVTSAAAGQMPHFNGGGYVIQNGNHGPTSYTNGYSHVTDNGAAQSKPASQVNANGKVPCHLCGKKTVVPPVVYCQDCDFYMSRFKPR